MNITIPETNIVKEIYSKPSKYLTYFIPTDMEYDPVSFGNKELHDDIDRTVEWIPYNILKNKNTFHNKLHFRLKNNSFIDTIKEIHKLYL